MAVDQILYDKLIGQSLPPSYKGESGRGFEDLMESLGYFVNRGPGVDEPNAKREYKVRDVDAISPQTVSTISFDNLLTQQYEETNICEKFQLQLRIKTKSNVIVSVEEHDFSAEFIQEKIKEAYEAARSELIVKMAGKEATVDNLPDYIYGSQWGYLERVDKSRKQYHFRITQGAMDDYEAMSRSTYTKFF